MIKFENTSVFNFENAFRGMRNPYNSWDKSDSFIGCGEVGKNGGIYEYPYCGEYCKDECHFVIGANDLARAQSLVKAGSDHRKFLRQIFVSVDIVAPLYWWKEFDTYKVGTVANSCSTMHTVHKKEITIDDFSHENLSDKWIDELELVPYNGEYLNTPLDVLRFIVDALNVYRDSYNQTGDKKYWYDMVQLLPSSYNQRRTVTLNYEVLRNIRHSDRRNHKLDEWRVGFMGWIDSLPYAKELLVE